MKTRLDLFQAPEHQPFIFSAGRPAALLVHGFPGTPIETRPLGQQLYQQGWTVHGLLLPGFGNQIDHLDQTTHLDWQQSVRAAILELRATHNPVLVIGYSMGAAVCISAIAGLDGNPVDGLVLMAPFLWEDSIWQRLLLPALAKLLPPYLRPLRWANFKNPQLRRRLSDLIPVSLLDDAQTQAALRELPVPLSVLEEVRQAGMHAGQVLSQIEIPTLVVQGMQDPLVRPDRTRRFISRLSSPPVYREVRAVHDLLRPDRPAWSKIHGVILDFANQVAANSNSLPV